MSKSVIPLGEMDLEEFRRAGYQLIDWIAEYLADTQDYPVLSRTQPGEIRARLPAAPPEEGEPMDQILADFEEILLPGITHWNNPGFFAYFSNTGSGPGILGELLTAALNVNGMLWRTSPAATELEEVTLDWLRQLLGLPAAFRGMIVDTASMSSLLALAAAREAADLEIRTRGLAGRPDLPRLRLYTSEQSHSSIEKDAITLGLGQENVCKIPVDADFQMDPHLLAQAVEADLEAGFVPFCVVATVGTTSTTSIDPVPALAAICRQHQLWLHVDAAYGGVAAIVPEMRPAQAGCDQADSLVVNPHKWLFTPMDCSAFFVRDPARLQRAFSLIPEYLKTSDEGVTNYMDWGVQLGRRFRALKLWMVIRHFGAHGLASRIREHIRLAQELAAKVDADPGFTRTAPTPFSTVCFRAVPAELTARLEQSDPAARQEVEGYLDELNRQIIEAVNRSGEAYLSHTVLNGRYTLRMAISNIRTDAEQVDRTWKLLQHTAAELHKESVTSLGN